MLRSSDQLHSFEGKILPALPTFEQRHGSATYGTFVLCQSLLTVERQMLVSVE